MGMPRTVLQPMLDAATPEGGVYLNEAYHRYEDWKEGVYRVNYGRLLAVKKTYDPASFLYARTAVGSDEWSGDTNGRLCKTEILLATYRSPYRQTRLVSQTHFIYVVSLLHCTRLGGKMWKITPKLKSTYSTLNLYHSPRLQLFLKNLTDTILRSGKTQIYDLEF